ncbi:MAG: mechanosensitive ion channel family protein [Sulfitobacter sp.]|jgi:small conductance mechanosensitive channel|uniref:mechanosensitive ion channel family protein n=1 Tax=Alphaproteobacteria TaxID=28211 RepID=UPI0029439710|nr:mechanosensitive ion channel family protein [Sulfitobacter sp. LC.270.F.C4]WOI13621.1 mechanosensitive ion channel family protein [Sulfitobacter sp. LC.270.F.C4]
MMRRIGADRVIAFSLARILVLVGAFLALTDQTTAQDLGFKSSDVIAPQTVTSEDVRSALEELLSSSEPVAEPTTADDSMVALRELDILLAPRTLDELDEEMSAWLSLLRSAVTDLSTAELKLFELNAAQNAQTASSAISDARGTQDTVAAPQLTPEQEDLIGQISALRERRTGISDRFRKVIEAFEAKGGDPDQTTEYRAYISQVGGVNVDTSDLGTAWVTLKSWVTAEDGGLRVLRRTGIVLSATLVGAVIGWVASLAANVALQRTRLSSRLMRNFLRRWIARLCGLVGLLVGLSWIGTTMTPILAGLGAIGFILAFALQNTISNFASGLMILFLRPFDAGDEIEAAGISGEVEHVSLFSTHLSTSENRKVIVPNNNIWEDVIVNSTEADTRRLSLEVEVSAANHSMQESEEILRRVMSEHPGVLKSPAPDVTLSSVAVDGYTFTCWPWVRTIERDKIRWGLISRIGHELDLVKGTTKAASAIR